MVLVGLGLLLGRLSVSADGRKTSRWLVLSIFPEQVEMVCSVEARKATSTDDLVIVLLRAIKEICDDYID